MWNGQALPENHDKSLPRTGEDDGHPYGQLQHLVDKGVLRPSGLGRLSLLATLSHGIQGRLSRKLEGQMQSIINPKNRRKVSFSVETILYNCWICSSYQEMAPRGIWVVVVQPRSHDEYQPSSRYGTRKLSVRVFFRVLDMMRDRGLVDIQVEKPLGNLRSSYWPTAPLQRLMSEGASESEIKAFCKEVIILKDEDKNLVDYKDTRRTISMRKGVKALNASNSVHKIELQVPETSTEIIEVSAFLGANDTTAEGTRQIWAIKTGHASYMISVDFREGYTSTSYDLATPPHYSTTSNNRRVEETPVPVQVSILYGLTGHFHPDKKLISIPLNPLLPYQRTFCRADWTKGGRWYANIQNISSALRPLITIDDEQTVELDYNALHARLLLAQAGAVPEGDPYTVNLKGWQDKTSLRAAVKLAFQVFLNVKTRKGAIAALYESVRRGELRLEQGFKPADLLDAFLAEHPCLAPFMCSDKGVDLQCLDAEIAGEIFRRFLNTGRPIIGIHDSFIVKLTDEEFLREAMVHAYRERVGQDPVMKRIQGVSGFKTQESLSAACTQ